MARSVDPVGLKVKALVTFLSTVVAKEDTFSTSKGQFVRNVRPEERVACTIKGLHKRVIWLLLEELKVRRLMLQHMDRKAVDEIDCCEECIYPIVSSQVGLCKKGQGSFSDAFVFAFGNAILF